MSAYESNLDKRYIDKRLANLETCKKNALGKPIKKGSAH